MAEEIVRYEDRDGVQITLTPQDVALYCASGTTQLTQRDVVNFMATCKALGANPYLGDVYLVKYSPSENAQIMAGKNYYTRVAVSIPSYDGVDAGIVCVTQAGEVVYRRGSLPMPGDDCIGGWAEVFDKRWGHPVRAEVAMAEYNSHRSLWKSKPLTMIRKVALVQALREAYPDRFAGTYDASEMGEKGEAPAPTPPHEVPVDADVQPAKTKPTAEETARMAEVCDIAASVGIDRDQARKYVWGLFQANGMTSVEGWAQTIAPQQPTPGSAEWAAQVVETADPGATAVAAGNMVFIADKKEEAVEPDVYEEDVDF